MTKIWALAADVFYHIHIVVFYMLSSLFWLMDYWDLQPKQTMQVKACLKKNNEKTNSKTAQQKTSFGGKT